MPVRLRTGLVPPLHRGTYTGIEYARSTCFGAHLHTSSIMGDAHSQLEDALESVKQLYLNYHSDAPNLATIAGPKDLEEAWRTAIIDDLPEEGWGLTQTSRFLIDRVGERALAKGHSLGTRYFGFVTGGALPEAVVADWLVSIYDQNVQVHLPKETLSTVIEAKTIDLLLQLLGLASAGFTGTLTTGATASNILGLGCGREACLRSENGDFSVAEEGLSQAPAINVFVSRPHASVSKAAALLGIGRRRVYDVGRRRAADGGHNTMLTDDDISRSMESLDFDLEGLGERLEKASQAKEGSIVVVGMGEVNTGALTAQIPELRKLCSKFGAWLHVDAAFSAFCCLLPRFEWISEHMALADSITSDGHKQLNVPYDCGLFFIKRLRQDDPFSSILEDVCGPGKHNAPAYLKSSSTGGSSETLSDEDSRSAFYSNLPSPLFRNLENSRRFRALPLYATLLSQGRRGISSIVRRNVNFARAIEHWMRTEGSEMYQVLTPPCSRVDESNMPSGHYSASTIAPQPEPWRGAWTTTVVLFRPHPRTCPIERYCDPVMGSTRLLNDLKASRQVYCSPTVWDGVSAIRIAVSNWRTGLDAEGESDTASIHQFDVVDSKDYKIVTMLLRQLMQPER